MSKEILLVVDAVSNEKGVSKDVIFGALEAALASAARKLSEEERDVRVEIDRSTGDYSTFRRWEVIADDEEMENEDAQLFLADAQKIDAEIEVDRPVDLGMAAYCDACGIRPVPAEDLPVALPMESAAMTEPLAVAFADLQLSLPLPSKNILIRENGDGQQSPNTITKYLSDSKNASIQVEDGGM